MPTVKKIESPEQMMELFKQYKKQTKEHPRQKTDYVGKDAIMVQVPLEKPLTYEGFKNYCYENICCVNQYFENQGKRYDEYIDICAHIKSVIRQDQIEGGMVGQYNPSITQRLNNLVEQVQNTVIEQPLFPNED